MTYRELVGRIQSGDPPALPTILAALEAAGRTEGDLIRDAFHNPPPRSGQPCRECGEGRLVKRGQHRSETRVTVYLACNRCGHRPRRNKIVRALRTDAQNGLANGPAPAG